MSFVPSWMRVLNEVFGPDGIEELRVEDLPARGTPLREALALLGVDAVGVDGVLAAIPESHLYALRGIVESAIERRIPVQFSWMPGYDNELTVVEWADKADSPCGITVLLRSRHASDVRGVRTAR